MQLILKNLHILSYGKDCCVDNNLSFDRSVTKVKSYYVFALEESISRCLWKKLRIWFINQDSLV